MIAESNAAQATGIDIVVVAYGPPELLQKCLARLGRRYRVVVVDNSSSMATRVVVEGHDAVYLDAGENLGFAAAVNIALRRRRPDSDVLLLNPDAMIEPSAIEELREVLAANPDLCCVAPAQRHPDRLTFDRVAWPFPGPARAWIEAIGLARLGAQAEFLIGSILLLRSAAVADVGLFDERFFLYAEETDWQRRAADQGWKTALVEQVVAEHVGAGTIDSSRLRDLRFQAAQETYVRKWHGAIGWHTYRAAIVLGAVGRSIAPRRSDRGADRRRVATFLRGPGRELKRQLGGSERSAVRAPATER